MGVFFTLYPKYLFSLVAPFPYQRKNGINYQLGLVPVNLVTAIHGDDQSPLSGQAGQLLLKFFVDPVDLGDHLKPSYCGHHGFGDASEWIASRENNER